MTHTLSRDIHDHVTLSCDSGTIFIPCRLEKEYLFRKEKQAMENSELIVSVCLCTWTELLELSVICASSSLSYFPSPMREQSDTRQFSVQAAVPQLLSFLHPDRVRFSCCSRIMSASAAATRSSPLQLLPLIVSSSAP